MNTINMENSLLSTFLYADEYELNKDEMFKINSDIFTSSYRRAVSNKINDEIDGDKFMSYLSVTLEDHTKGTQFEQEWIDIIAQTPLVFSVAERIHEDLISEYKKRLARSFR